MLGERLDKRVNWLQQQMQHLRFAIEATAYREIICGLGDSSAMDGGYKSTSSTNRGHRY